ncbi:MOSC domain-containing protein, partial [Bowmanella dokdonensis]
IRIGEVEFKLDSPCSRCVFTTRDPRTGEFLGDQEPLKTLGTFRKDRSGKINFGMNLIPVNEGRLEVGMSVEVLQADKK